MTAYRVWLTDGSGSWPKTIEAETPQQAKKIAESQHSHLEAIAVNDISPRGLYESTHEFRMYLSAKQIWEEAHAAYKANPSTPLAERLLASQDFMRQRLELARQTPQHKLAFGW